MRLILFFLFSYYSIAINVNKVQLQDGDRVGVFIGSFSPPHLRHQEIIEDVLRKANLDYVVVIANDTTPHKPDIVKLRHRIRMLFSMFASNEQVLVMKRKKDFKYPRASSVINALKSNANITIVGITGYDSITKKLTKIGMKILTTGILGENLYHEWVAVHTNEHDITKIPRMMGGIPINPVLSPSKLDIHSSEIRDHLAHHNNGKHEHLHPKVEQYARERDLYAPKLTGFIKRTCVNLIQLIFKI